MTAPSYESSELLQQYLLFHYGEEADQMPWTFGPREALGFPERCVREGVSVPASGRALDVGCAVGRSTFELGFIFAEVIGIDYSSTFVEAAQALARSGELAYSIQETGTILRNAVARRPAGEMGQVSFEQGDAEDLRPDLDSFDCVLAANLLCRLGRPQDFLDRLPGLVKPGGQLIITTPNTWLESFTAKEYWIGATPQTGQPLEALKDSLSPAFDLVHTWDMPFLIREHSRKFQWAVAQASRWIRK
jgi:putative 4-mercaptohistidine N1-methyltranferase